MVDWQREWEGKPEIPKKAGEMTSDFQRRANSVTCSSQEKNGRREGKGDGLCQLQD